MEDDIFEDNDEDDVIDREQKMESTELKDHEMVELNPHHPIQTTLFKQWAEEWNVDELKILQIHKQLQTTPYCQHKNYKLFLFCFSKNITEERFRLLFFEATSNTTSKISTPGSECRRLPDTQEVLFACWWLTNFHPMAQLAQRTLSELLDPSHSSSEIPPEISFDSFVKKHPEWGMDEEKKTFVFFRDHKSIQGKPNVLIQRRQLSGNCYIHGPVVTHHYLMCKTNDEPQPAVDIRKYILRNLKMDKLSKLITHVGGGSSKDILIELLAPKAELIPAVLVGDICQNLHQFGPGLVTGFAVEQKFHTDCAVYRGSFTSPIEGCHSMVCVGYRKEKDEILLLFQNWWTNKQFVACDAAYFAESGATILFSKKEKVTVPSFHPCTMAEYAEADSDGNDLIPEEYRRF